ncbi:MAG: hypothetical protein ACI9OJ_002432 [Myxococcota bacterium]|jgi:hypothetical protein
MTIAILVSASVCLLQGCSSDSTEEDSSGVTTDRVSLSEGEACRPGAPAPGTFTDGRLPLGIDFVHNAFPPVEPGDGGNWTIEDLPGVALADLNGDDVLDMVFTNGGGPIALYVSGAPGAKYARRDIDIDDPTRVVTAGDLDGDGDRDLAIVTRGEPVWLENDGAANFGAAQPLVAEDAPDVSVFSIALGDLNQDGRVDLLLGGQHVFDEAAGTSEAAPEQVLLGSETGFTDGSAAIPTQTPEDLTFLAAFADFDDDGDLDIYEINDAKDSGGSGTGNRLLKNDGGVLTDVTSGSGAGIVTSGMGGALGDYDNDGLLDVYVTAMRPDKNTLLRNSGSLAFNDETTATGTDTLTDAHDVAWGAVFFDADADGWLDLFVSHGFIEASDISMRANRQEQPNVLLRNSGSGAFTDMSVAAGVAGPARSRSPVVGDINRDGFPDLVVGNVDEAPYIYLNGCDDRPWLTVRLIGAQGNRDAVGSQIRVTNSTGTQTRQILPGSQGLYGSSAPEAAFGFVQGTDAVTIEVRGPTGQTETFGSVPTRRHVTLRLAP